MNRENIVENNRISHIGRLYRGSPAIFVWQSGENRIANNLIHDTPYAGIAMTGRIVWGRNGREECSRTIRWDEVKSDRYHWTYAGRKASWSDREKFLHSRNNLVLRNDIHDVMQVCCDGNCIYISGAGGGNRIIENYCHDTPSPHMNTAIRCDDDQNDTLIERNIIHRTCGDAEGLLSKGRNTMRENLLVDLRTNSGRHRGASYKDIQIQPLSDKQQWTDLFAHGREGLEFTGNSKWTFDAETRNLSARGNNAMAFTKREYAAPYELQAWVKCTTNENGGITFNSGKGHHGVEIQCFNTPDTTKPTGSLYGYSPAKRVVSRDGEWFLIQLFNDGKRAEVFVNGEKVSESDALEPPYNGRIGFQQHTPNGTIHHRGARIRPLE